MVTSGKNNKYLIPAAFAFLILFSGTNTDSGNKAKTDDYSVFAPEIPDLLYFAGEKVPLFIPDVKERFDRELLINAFFHSNTFQCVKRANRWFPVIIPILKKNGVPEDFKYLAVIESDFLNKVSPSGAAGYWQFLESTGKLFGLEINDAVDERYQVKKATEAACSYLKMAHDIFGNWTLCAAAYNMGMDNLKTAVAKQKVTNYYDLYLNQETSRYVFRIISIKEIMENPKKYGFNYENRQLYDPYESHIVKTDTTIDDLVEFALKNKITYKELKILNPWLKSSSLKNKARKTYEIDIPDKSYRADQDSTGKN